MFENTPLKVTGVCSMSMLNRSARVPHKDHDHALTTTTYANPNATRRHRYENKGDATGCRKNTARMRFVLYTATTRMTTTQSALIYTYIYMNMNLHSTPLRNQQSLCAADAVIMCMLQLDDCGVATTMTTSVRVCFVNDGQQQYDVFSIDASSPVANNSVAHTCSRRGCGRVGVGRSMLPISRNNSQ